MKITAGGASTKGPHRKQNEDAWRIYADQALVKRAGRGTIYSVADGVGGTGAGRYASWQTVDGLSFFFSVPAGKFDAGNTMKEIISRTHQNLLRLQNTDTAYTKARSTLSLIYADDNGRKGYMLSIGDSGCFVVHKGTWVQLNQDHRDERGKVTSSLGGSQKLQISYRALRFSEGDVFLLCTDGVRDEIGEPVLREMLMEYKHPSVVAHEIAHLAEANGGSDNSTAVVVRIGDCPDPPDDPLGDDDDDD